MRWLKKLFAPLPPLEVFAQSGWGTACSPDDILVAGFLESLAKEPDIWSYDNCDLRFGKTRNPHWQDAGNKRSILSRITSTSVLRLKLPLLKAARDWDGNAPWIYRFNYAGRITMFNPDDDRSLLLSVEASNRFLRQWQRLAKQQERAKVAAQTALRSMEDNELKWDMAEKILGLKRNEFGALVPVVNPEEVE